MKLKTIILLQTLALSFSFSLLQGNSKTIAQIENNKSANSVLTNTHQLLGVIEDQLTAVRSGDINKAYSEYTSSEFKKITSPQQFKQFISGFTVFSDNKSFQYNSINFEKSIATFEGALISKSGDTLQAEYDLVQENGKWKILGIQLFKPETTSTREVTE